MGTKKKDMVKANFFSTQKFAQEDQVPDTSRRFNFKVCLILFLVFTTGPKGVRSEDGSNPLIPGSAAMDSLLANKNLRGFKLSERRQMAGAEAAAMNDNINYNDFPSRNSRPNNPARKQTNPSRRPCNPGDYCRQGNKGKKN